ncbi:CCR4-NOT transcription complex subunit 4 [Portunus trituberculatus]|uniref:CCR4-NOT transcription complex subunit 4 n=1 Tax=Portunus trituberculatus TaxID=210409 RepID=A0A5B7KBR3_PORTR|nr:CCR4-NOT transcription complex subunit 4 [Portunus trituberculatus]
MMPKHDNGGLGIAWNTCVNDSNVANFATGDPLSDTGSQDMSVLNISEDMVECPLCMEPLEMDDLNFFPCTCGYQICRFCWHRIRTDENGLCPACRKAYPENPADFKPLSHEEYVFLAFFLDN